MSEFVKNPKVDAFLLRSAPWQDEFIALRAIVATCPLNETLKWGVPCYTYDEANVVLLHGFKSYCAILFIKGSLLPDKKGLLIQQTANVQAGRQMRFSSVAEIEAQAEAIRSYIMEAIDLEARGLKVEFRAPVAGEVIPALSAAFAENPEFKAAFEALTPGRQRAYLLFFAAAKQEKTQQARISRFIPAILLGKGLNE